MRRIEFRGKTIECAGMRQAGEWAYGGYFVDDCYGGCPEGKHHIVEWNSTGLGYFAHTEVLRETVGQFTGIKDKNGKKVYEGDVVLNEDSQHAIVKYDNSTAQFYLDLFEHGATSFLVGDIIVKGNMYDNPELLQFI